VPAVSQDKRGMMSWTGVAQPFLLFPCHISGLRRTYGCEYVYSITRSCYRSSTALRKGREERGTHPVGSTRKIKSLGHPSMFTRLNFRPKQR
jgi:hypothetical protein